MTLIKFSRSQECSDCWKMACLNPFSRMNGWIWTKPVHLYCCDMEKNWLDFGDLDPIFKVTQGLRLLQMACLHPISWRNGWVLAKIAQLYKEKNWLDFGDLDPIFKVTRGLSGLSAPYVQNEWMDFDQTCSSILLWHGKELIRFRWLWTHFQGHTRP